MEKIYKERIRKVNLYGTEERVIEQVREAFKEVRELNEKEDYEPVLDVTTVTDGYDDYQYAEVQISYKSLETDKEFDSRVSAEREEEGIRRMTNEDIINSSAFKLINSQIDEKAKYIQNVIDYIPKGIARMYENPGYDSKLRTRVSYETDDNCGKEIPINASIQELKRIRNYVDDVVKAEEEIMELQRTKVRLLNDYDFTKGDETFQKEIFGEVVSE